MTLLLVLILFYASTANADEPLSHQYSIHNDRVQFSVPVHWVEMGDTVKEDRHLTLFQIPNPADEGTPHSANALVSVYHEEELTLQGFSDFWIDRILNEPGSLFLHKDESGNPVQSVFAVFRTTQESTAYIVADKYARRQDLLIHIRISWPFLSETTKAWEESMVNDSNALFSNILVDGEALGRSGQLSLE